MHKPPSTLFVPRLNHLIHHIKMKERITYVVRNPEQGFDPANLEIKSSSLSVKSLVGAKEHQITLGLSELPQEVCKPRRHGEQHLLMIVSSKKS